MKKTFKFAAVALMACAMLVACKNNSTEATDTIPADTIPVEAVMEAEEEIDTVAVVEEVKPATKVTKKKDQNAAPAEATTAKTDINGNTNAAGRASVARGPKEATNNGAVGEEATKVTAPTSNTNPAARGKR
ncbi:MAG: hypothetical protein IJ524_04165 [Bacteroidales bacterium]|nr:hypothetical protein [Bacteroidales bacterium]